MDKIELNRRKESIMKRLAGFAFVLMMTSGMASVFAQTTPPAEAAPVQISDTEAVWIAKAINGHMQGVSRGGRLELFDRKKGKMVKLTLDRIVTDDPARIAFPDSETVAICTECTQIKEDSEGEGKTAETGAADSYEVWFLVKRGNMATTRVLDTAIKSVNGKPMYVWTRDANGRLVATLVPDAETP